MKICFIGKTFMYAFTSSTSLENINSNIVDTFHLRQSTFRTFVQRLVQGFKSAARISGRRFVVQNADHQLGSVRMTTFWQMNEMNLKFSLAWLPVNTHFAVVRLTNKVTLSPCHDHSVSRAMQRSNRSELRLQIDAVYSAGSRPRGIDRAVRRHCQILCRCDPRDRQRAVQMRKQVPTSRRLPLQCICESIRIDCQQHEIRLSGIVFADGAVQL